MIYQAHGFNSTYPVVIKKGLLHDISKYFSTTKKVFLIVDRNVDQKFYNSLRYDDIFLFEASEYNKTISKVGEVINILTKKKYHKDDFIVSIGGGITSDLVGFISATYKRGINWINIPSTTLAMVDAAVGGKNGLNVGKVKNQIGTFHFPNQVFIDVDILSTLTERLFSNGLCECLKMGLTLNNEILELLNEPKKNIEKIIIECIRTKDVIVSKDILDQNARRVLNFGHTFGHAIELNVTDIFHGEAIALGMRYVMNPKLLSIVDRYLKKFNIDFNQSFNSDEILDSLFNDKKIIDEKVQIIYLNDLQDYEIKYLNKYELEEIMKGDK